MSDHVRAEWPSDPVLQEFLPEFVNQWRTDLGDPFRDIVARQNADDLYRLGHTIKGSFLQFGFRSLAAHGRTIMAASESKAWADAEAAVSELRRGLDDIQARLTSGESA